MQSENKIINNKKSFLKKNKKIVLILIFAILIFGLLFYFLIVKKNQFDQNGNKINSLPTFNFSFKNLFSDSNNNSNNVTSTSSSANQGIDISGFYFEGLLKIWDKPVAGYNYYLKPYSYTYTDETGKEITTTLNKTILEFVDSETGYVYEKDLSNPTSTPYQVTKQSYPNIARAYFLNDKGGGKGRVFMQYFDNNTIKTISGTIPNYYNSPANLLNLINLPDNIKNIAVSNDNTKLAYIVTKNKTTNDNLDSYTNWYVINDLNDSYGKLFYTSEFAYWKLIILNSGDIYAFTADTYSETNTLYKVNTASSGLATLSTIYNNHNGMYFLINKNNILTSISTNNGTKLFETSSVNSSFSDSDLTNLNFQTLANKCTQNDADNENLIICSVPKEMTNYEYGLPDAWYQGMTTFDDNLYVANDNYYFGQLLYDFKNDGKIDEIIDGKDLKINNTKTHLAFINKNDGALWTLNIANILNENSGD